MKPNIIFILTDDQGAWAMQNAGNTDVNTPNLDYLAEHGKRFENFFCTSPVCSPARASILTGKMPSQHGVHDWIRSGNLRKSELGEKEHDPYYESEDIPIPYLEDSITYPDILKKNGYTLALAGKWHLGDSMRPQHGFSKWFTIGRGGCFYNKADIVEDGKLYYEDRYITDVITEKALAYIEELTGKDNPYYLSVHYTAPHSPWEEEQHPKEWIEKYRNCEFTATPDLPLHPWQIPTAPCGIGETRKELLRGYYAAISAMDEGVGRILGKLREQGVLDQTLVFFMSDNGMNMGHHGIWGKGNGTFPFNLYDTAVKVPFLASYPDRIEPGIVSSLHSQYDFIHTLLDLLDMKESLSEDLPGKSFACVLDGEEAEEEDIVVYDEYGPNRMIRSKEWKYIHRYPYGPDELYHLTADVGEENNLIDQAEYAPIVEQMSDRMEKWFCRYADPKLDGAKENVSGFGQLRRAGIYSEGKQKYYPGHALYNKKITDFK